MLTSLQNPTIKLLRKLHQLNGRREQQRFLVEGTHLVEEAIATGWPLESLFYTIRWGGKHAALLAMLDSSTEAILVSDQVMQSLAIVTVGTLLSRLQRQPHVVRIQSPALAGVVVGGDRQRDESQAVELADAARRGDQEVARLVLLDAADVIVAQPVLGRETSDGPAVVAAQALPVAAEPKVAALVLEHDQATLRDFSQNFSQGGRIGAAGGRAAK